MAVGIIAVAVLRINVLLLALAFAYYIRLFAVQWPSSNQTRGLKATLCVRTKELRACNPRVREPLSQREVNQSESS